MEKIETSIDQQEIARLKERFVLRAHAVFFARSILFLAYFISFFSPSFRPIDLGAGESLAVFFLVALALNAFVAKKFASHHAFGRWINFLSISIDILWLTYLILINGGLNSPLLAAVPIYTILFSLLFHSATAAIPPLLILPLITAFDLQDGSHIGLGGQMLILVFYSSLNFICIFLTNYSLGREEHESRQVRQLEKHLKTLAVIEERQRLAREIHDGLGGQLSGLTLQCEYLMTLLSHHTKALHEVKELKHSAEEATDELRRALAVMYDEFDLVPQLQNSCRSFSSRYKVPIEIRINGESMTLSHEKQLTIFRIMQECLTNIAKHAHAKHVDVDVVFSPYEIKMQIKDDGIGFNPARTPRNHYGLINLKERAKRAGGTIAINSAPGNGTHVDLRIDAV